MWKVKKFYKIKTESEKSISIQEKGGIYVKETEEI